MYCSQEILIAVRPVDQAAISEVLGDEFNTCVCYTLEQAIAHLNNNIALIVCGVRFDQGSMFDLLSAARSNANTSAVPYFLVIGEDVKYSPSILEGIKTAASLKGATGIIELAELTTGLGREQAYEHIRERIRKRLENHSNNRNARPRPSQHESEMRNRN